MNLIWFLYKPAYLLCCRITEIGLCIKDSILNFPFYMILVFLLSIEEEIRASRFGVDPSFILPYVDLDSLLSDEDASFKVSLNLLNVCLQLYKIYAVYQSHMTVPQFAALFQSTLLLDLTSNHFSQSLGKKNNGVALFQSTLLSRMSLWIRRLWDGVLLFLQGSLLFNQFFLLFSHYCRPRK